MAVKPHSSLPPPLLTVSYGISFHHTQSWEAVATSVCSIDTPGLQSAVWSSRHASCLAQGQNTVPGAKQVPRKGITSQDQPKHSTGLRAGVPTSFTIALQVIQLLSPSYQPTKYFLGNMKVSTHKKTNYIKSRCHRAFLSTSQSLTLASVETNNVPTMVSRYPGL